MSKKNKVASFTYTPSSDLPRLSKLQTEWNLSGLFYSSPTDPQIEKIVTEVERKYHTFARKYKSGKFLNNNQALLKSLHDYRDLSDTELDKVFVYLFLCKEKDAGDHQAEQIINQLQQKVTQFSNEVTFYVLLLGRLDKKRQKQVLTDKKFALYHHMLKGIFETAKHQLSEAEEKILSLKSLTARQLWIAGTEKLLGSATITVSGKTESLNGAMMEMLDAPKKRRHALYQAVKIKLQELGPVAENELVAVILDKKINDELRGYKRPYSATTLGFDSSDETLETLTDTITTDGYKLSQAYYRLKQKLHGGTLSYIDRDAFPKRMPELSYEQAVEICRDAFYDFNPIYGEIFDEMLVGGHIDVYPKVGKGGGAFCISTTNTPTLVMLNHSCDFSSLHTLAHEMGHAIHAHRSKTQDILYQDHSVLTAETASTFFEAVVAEKLMQQLSEAQKTIYLDARISDKISTMIMCIARYQAELEIHEIIRRDGAMTWQMMSATLAKHFRKQCGKSVLIEDMDGLSVLAKTHYRRNFYQYSYSFGVIGSSIMFARCLADTTYKAQVDHFLCSGERADVEQLFAEIDIDMSKRETFQEGLGLLADEIKRLKKLTDI